MYLYSSDNGGIWIIGFKNLVGIESC